jgi:tetratricopeptide (TPR) repeat protein
MRFSALPVRLTAFLTLAMLLSTSPVAADDEATCVNAGGDEAVAACTRAINSGRWTGSHLAWAYTDRGAAYRGKGDNDRAFQDFDQAIRLDPKIAAAYGNRGIAYHFKGDDDHALQDFDQAIRLDPKIATAYGNRGNIYKAKGDNDRAFQDYDQAIRLDPKYAFAYTGRGGLYKDKGDNDRAIQDFDQAIRLDPKFVLAYNRRGDVYKAKGDNDRAIQDYDQAIRLDPKQTIAYSNRGNTYQAKGDNDRAIADYSEAIGLSPKGAGSYFSRGRLYLYGGSVAKAQADFKQASELNPKDAYAALWLDLTGRRNNVPSHLAEAARQLDMTAWPAPVVRLFLGQITPAEVLDAARVGDAKTAKGQVCDANFYNGELALLQGTKDEATRLFRLAARDCPPTFVGREGANAELKALGASP